MKFVTAVMPTRGRNVWALIAMNSFLTQTYPWKQLLILDDRDDPSFREPPVGFPGVSYLLADERWGISAKLNKLCEMAAGDVIVRIDDDDWSAPERMADQVKRLEESGKQVSGYCSMLFHEAHSSRAFKYVGTADFNALGTSLAFTREWWQSHPFRVHPETPLWGEDNLFVAEARNAGQFVSVDAGQLMVARVHAGNTVAKDTSKYEYRTVSADAIPRGFFQ